MLRSHLKTIVSQMGLDTAAFMFHTFRCSGATLAKILDIPIEHIERHSTWQSDSVYTP